MKNNHIEIEVQPRYLESRSDPKNHRFAFSYEVIVHNRSKVSAKLLSRHWIITDGDNRIEEVHGAGVVGQQPLIAAGQKYRYQSGVVLDTPIGTMQGSYQMIDEGGHAFEASIPAFLLATPLQVN